MIIFLDENDVEYGALATIKATNAVNGERSITGEIISGDVVLSRIERGWRLRFEDEYYVVTFAKPIDEGKNVRVSFDAVHQFFWDFGKSSVYDQLSDGSHTFRTYLDFIFDGSGYKYDIETSLTVKAFEKQSFGYKNRLSLFNDIITSTGVEFQVNGKVVRILAKVGTDLSTVVRKNFNLNELGIEKNIGNFVTYQKGFGAYFDEEDHSKGRLIAEYTSPLASIYGKLEADPLVDERYKQQESLLSALKETVDNSYTISISLDMEDLTRAGYRYTQPVAGDYIMAINETLGFKEKIRIVSFTSEYDVAGQLIKHTVTCNDIGSVKKLSASYTQTQHQAANAEVNANTAYEFANKALVSANGKNTNYYGDTFPVDNPKGTLKKGDLLFLTVGDTVKQYYWNGAEWVTNPVVSDVEAFKEQIAEELKDVPNREEFENKISEEIANSKAEIGTQIETAKTQAESNAKEYADTINQETAKVAELANAAADEIKADLVNVKNNLTATSLVANNAQAAVDEAKQDLIEVASDLSTAKQDLTSHAQQLQTQANAQTELTKRVTIVETTASGTKTTVNELTKTVGQNGKDIASVTNRTKTVEDDLASTKTTLTQVQTTANSASQKTATLETGLNGLNAKFETLKIGSRNYFKNSKSRKYYVDNTETQDVRTFIDDEFWQNDTRFTENYVRMSFDIAFNPALPSNFTTNVHFGASPWYNCGGITFKGNTTALQHFDLKFDLSGAGDSYKTDNVFIRLNNTLPLNTAVSLENFNLYLSAVVEDYTQNEADIESKVAEYKQTADQNYASLQSNLQTLDGTVKQNKSEFDQTASQLRTSISTVEGKIPTDVSTRNLILKSNDFANPHKQNGANTEITSTDEYFIIKSAGYTANAWGGMSWNMSISEMKAGEQFSILMPVYIDSSVPLDNGWSFIIKNHTLNSFAYDYSIPTNKKDQWFNVAITFKAYNSVVFDTYPFFVYLVKNGLVRIKPPMLVRGNLIPSDYQPAFEDTKSDVTKLNTTLTQTANGLEQLSTQVTSQGSTIISHTTQISALNTGLSAKVSQTDFNTLSGRVTTAENNITAKANELSSKITSVEGKIPSGEINLVEYGRPADGYSPYSDAQYTTHGFYYNGAYKMYIIRNTTTSEKVFGMNRFKVERNTDYTLYFKGFNNYDITHMDVWFLKRVNGSTQEWDSAQILVSGRKLSNLKAEDISVTFNTGNYDEGYIRFDNNGSMTAGTSADLYFGDVSVKKGKSNNGWSPSLAELASSKDLKTAQSEFKQTTDSIKASVQSLDNNTVKSSSLTINSDGVVIKAGKSTSDFANAVGSYFSVNQNAINLFSDKINVKGSMIVSGAITSDKIASKQINTSHLNGKIITADVISSNAVTADAIRAGAVTTDKMSANSINGDRITAGTLDAAKIRAGSITASQIASGTITSAQIKTGTISAANIAAGAITSDKIAANSIDASKIAANAISANMITGGQLRSTNGATMFDLNAGTLTFNNNYGYIQRVANGKIFEITTSLSNTSDPSQEYLASAFNIRKSDNSRYAGLKFSLYNDIGNKPIAKAKMNADEFILYDSKNTEIFSVCGKSSWLGNFNTQGWGDIPVVRLRNGGLLVKDIGIGGHMKSLLKIVEELCNKTGIMWI
ncbi:phage tail protein [Streptococcus alactolyticus]|uniref:phage tail protein n=1 Tax=Streptococcus alactolyticus TaxID=29389 RepID=UPI0035180180